jgi:hypothetical protein
MLEHLLKPLPSLLPSLPSLAVEQATRARQAFGRVVSYALSPSCRRSFLLLHFGEQLARGACSGCDVCRDPAVRACENTSASCHPPPPLPVLQRIQRYQACASPPSLSSLSQGTGRRLQELSEFESSRSAARLAAWRQQFQSEGPGGLRADDRHSFHEEDEAREGADDGQAFGECAGEPTEWSGGAGQAAGPRWCHYLSANFWRPAASLIICCAAGPRPMGLAFEPAHIRRSVEEASRRARAEAAGAADGGGQAGSGQTDASLAFLDRMLAAEVRHDKSESRKRKSGAS